MRYLLKRGFREKINLAYIDPPYFSRSAYSMKSNLGKNSKSAFDDFRDGDIDDYISFLGDRLTLIRELLSEDGSVFVHVDWHASHRVRILLDTIFGSENFRNEIIWHYFMGGKPTHFFARKHDNIFFYTKGRKWKFNPIQVRRRLDFVPHLPNRSSSGKKLKNTIHMDEAGYYSIVKADDVWDIPGVFNLSREYTGYPTQKPLRLLSRIIRSVTDPGDIVADFFCGSGTTLIASERLGRRWIGSDISTLSRNIFLMRYSAESNLPASVTEGSDESYWLQLYRISVSRFLGKVEPASDKFFHGLMNGVPIYFMQLDSVPSSKFLNIIHNELARNGYERVIVFSKIWVLQKSRADSHSSSYTIPTKISPYTFSDTYTIQNRSAREPDSHKYYIPHPLEIKDLEVSVAGMSISLNHLDLRRYDSERKNSEYLSKNDVTHIFLGSVCSDNVPRLTMKIDRKSFPADMSVEIPSILKKKGALYLGLMMKDFSLLSLILER